MRYMGSAMERNSWGCPTPRSDIVGHSVKVPKYQERAWNGLLLWVGADGRASGGLELRANILGSCGRGRVCAAMPSKMEMPRELQSLVRTALPGLKASDGSIEAQLEEKAAVEMQHYLRLVVMRTTAQTLQEAAADATERRVLAILEAIRPTLRGE